MVGDDGKREVGVCDLVDVLDPTLVRSKVVGALQSRLALSCTSPALSFTYQANHLDAASIKLVLQLGKGTKLGGAYWRVVGRVAEQDCPAVANPLVEGLDVTLRPLVYFLTYTHK